MTKRKLINAHNKAMEVLESFENWKGSGVQGPPGAYDWGRPDLIKAGNKLLKVMQDFLKNNEYSGDEFSSFSDQIAQLVTSMAIKHANYYRNGKDMYKCRDMLKSVLSVHMNSNTKSYVKKELASITRNVEIEGGSKIQRDFIRNMNLDRHIWDTKQENSNSGCYIATMVYGDYDHPKVMILRNFRDNFLDHYKLGKSFIKFYYRYSPVWVRMLEDNRFINKSIKNILNLVIKIFN